MRRWPLLLMGLALLLALPPCFAADLKFPPLTGRVVDEAGLLDPGMRDSLTQDLAAHEAKTGQQVVVAIVPGLQGQTIEEYGYRLGRTWGIGQKDKDTGAILLVAPKEHRVRIEVGYGLEGTLTDARCADIINDAILPLFKAGQMQKGVAAGVRGMLNVLEGRDPGEIASPDDTAPAAGTLSATAGNQGGDAPHNPAAIALMIAVFLVLIFIHSFLRPRSMFGFYGGQSWGGGGGGGGFSGGGGSFGGGGASGSW